MKHIPNKLYKMSKMLNLTPHDIVIYNTYVVENGERTKVVSATIPKSGMICCMEQSPQTECSPLFHDSGEGVIIIVPIKSAPKFTKVTGLPSSPPYPDIIVSMHVGEFIRNNPGAYPGTVLGSEDAVIQGTNNLALYKAHNEIHDLGL